MGYFRNITDRDRQDVAKVLTSLNVLHCDPLPPGPLLDAVRKIRAGGYAEGYADGLAASAGGPGEGGA